MEDLVIYEMHVRGFTRHPSSGVSAPGAQAAPLAAAAAIGGRPCNNYPPHLPAAVAASVHLHCRDPFGLGPHAHALTLGTPWPLAPCTGTYAGMIEKLDYLQRLGVNAVELMPVHEFNELEYYQVPVAAVPHRTALHCPALEDGWEGMCGVMVVA